MTRSSSGTRYARACCRTQLSNQDARAPIATCFQPRRPCLGSIWITNVMRKHQSSHVIIKCSFAALASIRLVEEGTKERHSRLGRLAWLRITTRRRTSPSSHCSAVRAGKCGGTLVAEWQCDAATRSAIVPGCGRGSFTFKLGGALRMSRGSPISSSLGILADFFAVSPGQVNFWGLAPGQVNFEIQVRPDVRQCFGHCRHCLRQELTHKGRETPISVNILSPDFGQTLGKVLGPRTG